MSETLHHPLNSQHMAYWVGEHMLHLPLTPVSCQPATFWNTRLFTLLEDM